MRENWSRVQWWEDDLRSGDAIAIIWTTHDVLAATATEDEEDTLTQEQAREVLRYAWHNHDAQYGVTWDTLSDAADHLFGADRSTIKKEE
jgi:hypothetical protein